MTLTTVGQDDNAFLVTTALPTRREKQLAACVLLALVGALLVTAPFARIQLANTEILLPAYAAAVLLNELITAALLLALYFVQRSLAVLALSAGYLFTGLTVIPWAISFPGVFEALGVDMGLQSTASIAVLRRIAFPLFVLAYALLKGAGPLIRSPGRSVEIDILLSVAVVVVIVCVLTWLIAADDGALPTFMRDTRNISPLWQYVPPIAIFLYIAGIGALWFQKRSVLDLWLMVVLCTLLIEIVLLSYVSGGIRLSIGWWAGRICGLISASTVLVVLLSETTVLYARLTRSVAAERRTREARLSAMEALSATIAHEVNQPVASMVTNANAGLRWLSREGPDADEARAALERIVRDGHRAGEVIKGVRTMFRKGTRERALLDVNIPLVQAIMRSRAEASVDHVVIQTVLAENLPPIMGSRVQLEQVVSNLIANGLDAVRAVPEQNRVLLVSSSLQDAETVVVSVEDNGPGLDPEHDERIFAPFYTTKPDGMGMGLMFCRSVVEAHGGRLWAEKKKPRGAIFRFTLPCSIEEVPLDTRDA